MKINSNNIEVLSLAGLGIAGLYCITSEEKLTRNIGAGLLGATAIGALSSFAQKKETKLSKNKVILFGGADFYNEGKYGTNKEIGRIVSTAAQKIKIPLKQGDIRIFNSPLFVNDFDHEIVKPFISSIINNFDRINGKLILYGYSLGGNILMHCLEELKKNNIKVDLLVTIDSAKGYSGTLGVKTIVPDNIKLNLNIYQTKASIIGSRGFPNKGKNVINIDLSGVKNNKKEEISHNNIDEYTMLFVAQVILYQMQNINRLNNMNNSEILEKIALFDKQN
jgi:hypothetical protein